LEAEVSGPQHHKLPDLDGLKSDLLKAATSGALKAGQAIIVGKHGVDSAERTAGTLTANRLVAVACARGCGVGGYVGA
jgi:hypothetical protein